MPSRFETLQDPDVVRLAQVGSLEACDELVRRYRGAVLVVATQVLRSQEAAQDVAQEAFLTALRALPQLQDPAKFPSWLYAITRRRAQRVSMRGPGRREITSLDLERLAGAYDHDDCEPGPLDIVLRTEAQDYVRLLLADLTPELQITLCLFYYERWTAVRIAEFLSLPLTTVKWRLRAGRTHLSRRLKTLLEE